VTRPRVHRARRAFTILELTLALLVSTLVISSAFGLFRLMTTTNRVLAVRAEQFVGVGAARMSMESAFGSLVLAAGTANEQETALRPRLILSRRGQLGGAQRLEMVVQRPPLPGLAPFVERASADEGSLRRFGGSRDDIGDRYVRHWDGRPIRGAFELEPEPVRTDSRGLPLGEQTWRLVWRNLEVGGEPVPDIPRQRTVLLDGIVAFDWSVFQDRRRRLTYEATRTGQIPAYAECRVRTSAGHSAEWLFELDWINGSVDRPPDMLAALTASGGGGLGGDSGAGDGDGDGGGGGPDGADGGGATDLDAFFDDLDAIAQTMDSTPAPGSPGDLADRGPRGPRERNDDAVRLPEPDEYGRRIYRRSGTDNARGPR